MATVTSLTTTYAGKYAGEYIRKAFVANETLQHITVKENIDYKQIVKRLVDDITFAAPTCDFDPTGTVTITERVLTLEKFQVHRELCKKDFLTDWAANDAQNGRLEPALVENIIDNMLAGIAAKNETVIWQGVNATTGEYAGFETLFAADATVIDASSDEALTTTNILEKIEEIVGLMPTAVKRSTEKPVLYLSNKAMEAYINKQASLGNGFYYQSGNAVSQTWIGLYQMVVCPGMSDDTIVFAQPSNLWFGTNLLNDWNRIQVKDMEESDLSDNVRFKAQFFAAVQYGFGNEIVFYKFSE
jgi:hypothetical protein